MEAIEKHDELLGFIFDINNQSNLDKQLSISNEDKLFIGSKQFNIDIPIFKFIIHNPTAPFIPSELIHSCVGETNYKHQTPLMLSVVIGNFNFVKQLIYYDIGKLDDYEKSALDYAYENHVSQEIIDLLEEYECGY